MKELLQKIQDWRGRPGEDSNQIFERIAEDFLKDTGFLRPGKDCQRHSREERNEVWEKWITEKNNQLDAEIAEALEKPDVALEKPDDDLDKLAKVLGFKGKNVIDSAINYIEELRLQVPNDPRATNSIAGWDAKRRDVNVASCSRCGSVEPCVFTHEFGGHSDYWCYTCYMKARR